MWPEHAWTWNWNQCLIAPLQVVRQVKLLCAFPQTSCSYGYRAGSVLALFEESKPSNTSGISIALNSGTWRGRTSLHNQIEFLVQKAMPCISWRWKYPYRSYTMFPCFMLLNHVPGSLHNCETALFLTYIRGWKIGTMVSSMWSFVFRTTMFAIHLPRLSAKHQLLRGRNHQKCWTFDGLLLISTLSKFEIWNLLAPLG